MFLKEATPPCDGVSFSLKIGTKEDLPGEELSNAVFNIKGDAFAFGVGTGRRRGDGKGEGTPTGLVPRGRGGGGLFKFGSVLRSDEDDADLRCAW